MTEQVDWIIQEEEEAELLQQYEWQQSCEDLMDEMYYM
jgi:hypothetical protein